MVVALIDAVRIVAPEVRKQAPTRKKIKVGAPCGWLLTVEDEAREEGPRGGVHGKAGLRGVGLEHQDVCAEDGA